MTEIRYYPVIDADTEGHEKRSMMPTAGYDAVKDHHRFWLEEIVPYYFRLCAAEPQSGSTVSRFKITCPHCGKILSPISTAEDGKRFFLFACKNCLRKEKEKRK